ncbi:MAG: 50S ribosomal protein L13 [Chloroflexota bacterium]|nr:50S ribosomal protein L13 [Chloroflexota bacterium]MDE2909344.1 50S ribosomal protein L13 [Chloroflexota bacterium]
MRQIVQKTYATTPDVIERRWWVVDARGMTLGRVSSKVAQLLRGTHKPYFTPHLDTGDYVIIVNADKIHVTGKRMDQKTYYRHSGYPGGLKSMTLREMMHKFPTRALRLSIKGMLPKGPLGRRMFKKLKVYAGAEHPHQAQQPQILEL